MDKKECRKQSGMVMLEGVFAITVAIIVMAMLLAFGFYLYQRTAVRITVNRIAEEAVVSYKYKDVSGTGQLRLSDVTDKPRFRYLLSSGVYKTAANKKAKTIASSALSMTALAKAQGGPVVTVERIGSDLGRCHYKVTLITKYNFLLGDLLKYFGIQETEEIKAVAITEGVDISDYVNTVKMTNYGIKKFEGAVPLFKAVGSVVSMINSIYKIFI